MMNSLFQILRSSWRELCLRVEVDYWEDKVSSKSSSAVRATCTAVLSVKVWNFVPLLARIKLITQLQGTDKGTHFQSFAPGIVVVDD